MASNFAEAFFIMDWIIMVLAFIMVCYSIYLMHEHRRWWLVTPLVVWSLHLFIFYGLLTYTRIVGTDISHLFGIEDLGEIWSIIQRLHGVITVFFLSYVLHIQMTRPKK